MRKVKDIEEDSSLQPTAAGYKADKYSISKTVLWIFKRNTNAFSLNAIVDIHRRRLHRRHEMIFVEYIRKY